MRVFRLSKRKYAHELSGKGAAKFGNRWNSKGVEIIYTSQNRALAMAEVVVHLSLVIIPNDFVMLEIDIPDEIKIQEIALEELSTYWNTHPPINRTQQIGDRFIYDNDCLILKVPSAVVPGDYNILINPHHVDFNKVMIVDTVTFPFDQRMFL